MAIQLKDVTKKFAGDPVFKHLSLSITEQSRIGLVGRNGCGKSTILKLIMGIYEPEAGMVTKDPGVRVNHLTQEPCTNPDWSVEEELRSVYAHVDNLQEKEAEILKQFENPENTDEDFINLSQQLERVQHEIERSNPATIEMRISRILKGLGFSEEDARRPTKEFSGGWQMRINLGKILLEEAEILLLDEPTNHLDLATVEWLESYLKEYRGGIVLVSHDRRFLDQVTTEIFELDQGQLTVWAGNYSSYLEQKEAAIEHQQAAYDRQQKEIQKQQEFVDKFRASARRSTQAKSREKQLAKMERVEAPKGETKRMRMNFPEPEASGMDVLTLGTVSKSFGDNTLFNSVDALISRGERVFLLGGNGTGKTTLLKLILDQEKPDKGKVDIGHNVKIGYFSQNQLDTLDAEKTAYDTIHDPNPTMTNTDVRTLLGRFLFTGDKAMKPVKVLSGGEKSKLALARLMMEAPNTLLLDEPTNHMDIPSKEVITDALLDFEGSMLCISHDRYFIEQLATHIWEIYNGELITYAGGYDYYLSKRDELRAGVDARKPKVEAVDKSAERAEKKAEAEAANPLKAKKENEKEIKKAEKRILELETEINEFQKQLSNPDIQQDFKKLSELSESIDTRQKELDALNAQWEKLSEALV